MEKSDKKIELRPYKEGDEDKIAKLFYENFPHTLDPQSISKTWLWQFKNEFSKDTGVAVASCGSDIAAHYAVMWLDMIYQGKLINGAISSATVTGKKFRSRGLFPKLAAKVYEEIKNDGCPLVFGFPNSQSIRGLINKLDWFEIAKFPVHLKPINFKPFFQKFIGNNIFASFLSWMGMGIFQFIIKSLRIERKGTLLEFIPIKDITEDMNSIWQESIIGEKIAIARNNKYLKWRYLKKPFSKYNLNKVISPKKETLGYVITSIGDIHGLKILYIMEVIAKGDDKNVYEKILTELDKYAVRNNVDSISIFIFPTHPNYNLFLKHGFIPVPRKLFPQEIYLAARVNSDQIDKNYVKDPKNWYISWGDFDVV